MDDDDFAGTGDWQARLDSEEWNELPEEMKPETWRRALETEAADFRASRNARSLQHPVRARARHP